VREYTSRATLLLEMPNVIGRKKEHHFLTSHDHRALVVAPWQA
jgi:hypothetical protein